MPCAWRSPGRRRIAARAVVAAILAASGAVPASGQCQVDKLLASDGSSGDEFGTDVDVCGDVAIVGGFLSNAAYIYRSDGATWVEETILVAEDAVPADLFGKAVAISGDVAVVGANGDDDNGGFASGSAYVFRYRPASKTWVQEVKLLASDGAADDRFGWSVAVNGETVVIGALTNDNGTNSGSAYVFRFDGASWVEEAKLLASDSAAGDHFGWSVAVDGDIVIAGAFGHAGSGNDQGLAYIFRSNGSAWVQEAELLPDDAPYDLFGWSVSISGDMAVVGSPGDGSGSAFVFRFDGTSWTQEAQLLASGGGEDPDAFGDSVSVDGDVVVIGAPTDHNKNGIYAGAAYVFRFKRSGCPTWLEVAKLLTSDGADYDIFGMYVAVSDDVAVVGADRDDDNGDASGSAYVFAGLTGVDCNANGIADACDLDDGTSTDADGNGVPDECDCPWDLDGNAAVGITDFLGVLVAWGSHPGGPPDFNGDGTVGIVDFLYLLLNWGPCPAFGLDCNGNGVFDSLDIVSGTSLDCNCNGVPDECDVATGTSRDCNSNGVPDECEPADCNGNGVPDDCDLDNGTSQDYNGNGIPDECDPVLNDNCPDAIPIKEGSTFFVTLGATTDGPLVDCGGGPYIPLVNDIWFVYTAPCTGIATFSLCNSADFDTLLAVYYAFGCPGPTSVNPLACSNDAPGCGQTSEVQMQVFQGIPYLLRVGSPQGAGSGILTVSCQGGP